MLRSRALHGNLCSFTAVRYVTPKPLPRSIILLTVTVRRLMNNVPIAYHTLPCWMVPMWATKVAQYELLFSSIALTDKTRRYIWWHYSRGAPHSVQSPWLHQCNCWWGHTARRIRKFIVFYEVIFYQVIFKASRFTSQHIDLVQSTAVQAVLLASGGQAAPFAGITFHPLMLGTAVNFWTCPLLVGNTDPRRVRISHLQAKSTGKKPQYNSLKVLKIVSGSR